MRPLCVLVCLLGGCPGELEDASDAGLPDVLPGGPTRYPALTLRSPVTPSVAERMRQIAAASPGAQADVFMKVGASGTVSTNLLYCFAGPAQPQYVLDLAGRDTLLPTITFFRGGDAAGSTPFDRDTLAAEVGMSAVWAITGDPSPLEQEMAAINPKFAFVNYGTNDMGQGTTPASALFPFYANLSLLLDQLEAEGIVPIVTGLNPRSDVASYALWVPTYNAVTRGMAEARQTPYINMYEAAVGLANMGLISDGIHGNVYRVGSEAEPCVFTPAGLAFNYNVRNLLSIETLDVVKHVVLDGENAPDTPPPQLLGDGTATAPFVVDGLPFTHAWDTRRGAADISGYPSCDAGQDESGPEVFYRLDLAAPTALRVVLLDRAGVDVDVHLLGAAPDAGTCSARNDRLLQMTLAAGVHHLSVDTFVSGGTAQAGAYLLAVVVCEPGDPDCL